MNLQNIWSRKISDELSFFDQQRIRLLDRLAVISIALAIVMSLVAMMLRFYPLAIVGLVAIILIVLPVLWFQRQQQYVLARLLYLVGVTILIVYIALLSFWKDHFVEVENVLIGFSAISIFLLDNRKKILIYVVHIFIVLILKWYRDLALLDREWTDFYMTAFNTVMLAITVYVFVEVYRRALRKELSNSRELNEELLRGKKEVEHTRGMLYNMIDNIPLLLAMLDGQGNFLVMNKQFAEAMGSDERELLGQNYHDVLPQLVLDQIEVKMHAAFKGNEAEFDELMCFPSGEKIQVFGQIVPLFNDEGVYRLTLFMTDVGDLKEKEIRLQQLNDTKNKLFSIIAHDLKNPINLLQGLVHISNHGGFEEDEREVFIDRIQKNLGSVSHMMENLLVWARSQLDGYKITQTVCLLHEEFLEVWKVYGEIADKKGLKVETKIPGTHQVLMDRNHLQMIFRNLLSNAIKFTPSGGQIRIHTGLQKGKLYLEVSDTGQGMDRETRQAILNQQFVHSAYGTDGESGTGLGLSLCMEMLRQNGGSMVLESEEGVGTSFRLFLPRVE